MLRQVELEVVELIAYFQLAHQLVAVAVEITEIQQVELEHQEVLVVVRAYLTHQVHFLVDLLLLGKEMQEEVPQVELEVLEVAEVAQALQEQMEVVVVKVATVVHG
jgi:hypothetical protein